LIRVVSGYIYHCTGEYDYEKNAGVFTCATSKEPVPVADFEFVEDVYERIMSYEKQGTFKYERYEDLPQWRHDVIRGHVIRGIKKVIGLTTNRVRSSDFIKRNGPNTCVKRKC
jgi:hypothetical protein